MEPDDARQRADDPFLAIFLFQAGRLPDTKIVPVCGCQTELAGMRAAFAEEPLIRSFGPSRPRPDGYSEALATAIALAVVEPTSNGIGSVALSWSDGGSGCASARRPQAALTAPSACFP